jgi:hypothetical protein
MKPPFEEKETHELWLVVSRAGIYPCTDLTVHLPHSLFLSIFFFAFLFRALLQWQCAMRGD